MRKSRLALETLEDRCVPATLWVDATDTAGGTQFTATGGSQPALVAGLTPGVDSFSTIAAAVAAATAGDVINVADGTFAELVDVNKDVTLQGNKFGLDARTRTTADESVVGSASGAFQISADGVTIDGFTVSGVSTGLNAGVTTSSSTSGYAVLNNVITNNVIGIFANSDGASTIARNLITANNTAGPSGGAGIYSEATVGLIIDDNEISGHTLNSPILFAALGPVSHTNLTVSDNYLHGNVSGVFALGISGGLFQGNTITTGTATALTFGGANAGVDVLRNDLSGNARGLRIADFGFLGVTPNSDIEARFNDFSDNTLFGAGITSQEGNLTDGYTGTLDLSCNWWGDVTGPTSAANPGGSGSVLVNDFADPVVFQPWLLYGDADPAAVGFQIPATFTVTAQTSGFTATNNNYRRLVNAIACIQPGQTVVLSGNFDWTEPNAAAAWALGNDGINGTGDDYSLVVPPNVNGVTITAAALGDATIQGPGDLAGVNLEGVFVFDGGDNQNWTISNLQIYDFDLSIAFFNGAGGTDAFNGTTITNNRIRVPADLNATVAPADTNQNIGIHYSFGTNQTISNNQIELVASGASDSANNRFATVVGMQSNTSGGAVYDGLLITGNVLTVTGAQAADPSNVLGIWENAHGHTSDITVSNNQVLNQTTGGTPATNLIRAFRVTSHSSATTTVAYVGNTVQGANIGFQWLAGSTFAGNQAVRLAQNTILDTDTAILVQSNGIANLFQNTITGATGVNVAAGSLTAAGAVTNAVEQNSITTTGDAVRVGATSTVTAGIFNNLLNSTGSGEGVNNLSASLVNASGNFWGTNTPDGVAGKVAGGVDYTPWLHVGTDTAGTAGFQGDFSVLDVDDNGPQTGATGRITEAVGLLTPTGTVNVFGGTYAESVSTAGKAVTLRAGVGPDQVTLNGNLALDGDDALAFDIDGPAAGTGYDQWVVNGTVALNGAELDATGTWAGSPGAVLVLVKNDGIDAVTGTFLGLAEGATTAINGVTYRVTYKYNATTGTFGDGNDVALQVVALAPTTTASLGGTQGAPGWFGTPVTVTLTATGGDGGIASTQYQVNGGAVTPYAGPVTFDQEGYYVVTFWSVDNGGNVEAPQAVGFLVDLTVPALNLLAANGPLTVTNQAALSGFAEAGARIFAILRDRFGNETPLLATTADTNGNWSMAGFDTSNLADGLVTYFMTAYDPAGNASSRFIGSSLSRQVVLSIVLPPGFQPAVGVVAPGVTVRVTDGFGNAVQLAGRSVEVLSSMGGLGGTTTGVTDALGQAHFNDLVFALAGPNQRLGARTDGVPFAFSSPFTVV